MISDLISNGLYDLTHLEINTIVKSNMTASKITNSPRKLLHEIATTYHYALKNMGIKYSEYYKDDEDKDLLFRGDPKCDGSGADSFNEFQIKASKTIKWLTENKANIQEIDEEEIMEDAMILERIAVNSATIKDIINANVNSSENKKVENNFDDPKAIKDFKKAKDQKKNDKNDLKMSLQDILTLKKINDIGTEKILTQTVIGLDGDITTRISTNYAKHPVTFINEMHQEAISTSVNYWESLVKIFATFIGKLKK